MKNIIKEQLFKIVENKGLTIAELAEKSDLPLDTVKNIYYGRSNNPKLETLIAIADALEISIDFLIGRKYHNEEKLKLLYNYDACPKSDKLLVQAFAERGKKHAQFANKQEHIYEITCIIPTGYFSRDGMLWDSVTLEDEQTFYEDVDFAVRLPTNSYVPTYANNDTLFVGFRGPINDEESVILYKNDRFFIRKIKYDKSGDKVILQALTLGQNTIIESSLKEYTLLGTIIVPERCTRNTSNDGKIKKELPPEIASIVNKYKKEP